MARPPAAGHARRVGSPKSTQAPMTHVTGTGTFLADSTQRSIAGCAHLGFQRLGRRETTAGFVGTNVAPGDFARASFSEQIRSG